MIDNIVKPCLTDDLTCRYFLEVQNPKFSLYYEPHCISDRSILQNEQVDVIVTPVVKQVLPAYTLVSGMEDAVELVKILKPR